MNINNDNYELWLLRYAEQELTAEERTEVERWLAAHPEAAEELALYGEAPRLTKDESVKAPALPQHSISLWPVAMRWTAAAAVVAVLMMPAMRKVVAPTVEPTLVANLDSTEIMDKLDSLENPAIIEKPDNTYHQKPLSSSAEPLLAESLPSEAQQQIPDTSSEEPLPETEVPAPAEIAKPAYIVVDDLIVFEDDTSEEPIERDILADADITHTQSTSNINPIGHFISTFIKANK